MADLSIPSPFAWSERFDVRSAQFNEQHQKLFQLIVDLENDLSNTAKAGELAAYATKHFQDEEAMFGDIHLESAAAHKAIHDQFLTDFGAALAGPLTADTIAFAKQWLVKHILVSDMDYAAKF